MTEKIIRYKTMGITVPLWEPDTCHNPDCPTATPGGENAGSDTTKPSPLTCLHDARPHRSNP
jgi:hypothetical protein